MNCNVIKDLLPLYIDDCCSDESRAEVENHIDNCAECKKVLENMTGTVTKEEMNFEIKNCSRINYWKASTLQSVLLLASFLLIIVGVYFEAGTDYIDFGNGLAAFNIVVPATGFMISLINWYFIRLYKNKKVFSWCSCALTLFVTLCAFVWSLFHYEMNPLVLLGGTFVDFFEGILFSFGIGIFLTALFAVLSKVLSAFYAKMLGKE
ncbi:MAG: zf-HC2 domain-containing protein [Clostridia bacterium]|nr:zf-HC2 domain-containing protein [Clostridia bacterium]